MVERWFVFLLDGFLECPNILAAINFNRKYASRILAENTTIQQEQGRRRSTDYFKSRRVAKKGICAH